jgi:hypothetical protein
MNPEPLIPISLVLSSPLAALLSGLLGRTLLQTIAIAVFVTCLGGLRIPPSIVALLMGNDWWHDPIWCFKTMFVVGGIFGAISFLLAIPCGAATGALTAGTRKLIYRIFGIRVSATERYWE